MHLIRRVLVLTLSAAVLFAPVAEASVAWRNLDEAHYLSGRRTSEGYLVGKVVLVDRWGLRCPPCRKLLPLLEQHWQTFRNQDFVLIGGHCSGWGSAAGVRDFAREQGLTYSIYEEAGLLKNEPNFNGIPFLYVVDPWGKVIFRGRNDRLAVDYIVGALAKWESPATPQDWKNCIEFEIDNLPAHAILRFDGFKRKFPLEAANYETRIRALGRLTGMADLVRLVKIARRVREYRPKDDADLNKLRSRISETISKYSHLKESDDPQISREAKNAIADLQWMQAEL